nr:adenine phosphoribosyltransferase [Candidatus Dadabacteria bacterium]NIS07536.1 adenine phosphoribosyltransferase [Candidatus Dadabacteria bacterium]NIY21144.1 adenine phosphoribosyltransferase [Candidatus Dadabacteria bacterium]
DLKKFIRDIPGFPKEGINFHDITPLLQNPKAFSFAVDQMAEIVSDKNIQYIIGVEARGFIFGAALAYKLDAGLVIVRKLGKLPSETINASYDLEYGEDVLELHKDAIYHGENVLLVDDLLATGGTAAAVGELVKELGGNIVGYLFLIELTSLNGREKLKPYPVWSKLKYTE